MTILLLLLFGVEANPRLTLIESIAQQIERRYVLAGEAPRIARELRQRTSSYESIVDPQKLAEQLTADLRDISGDVHFAVELDSARASRLIAAGAATRQKLPEMPPTAEERETMLRTNFGFRRAEILDGNVALIELTSFLDLPLSRRTAMAAMTLSENADAVIFDVRRNPGGRVSLVEFLIAHFVASGTPLMSTFDRETGETTMSRTPRRIAGRRRIDTPLFVLTGRGTGSAAEAFAFILQQMGRAKIVGENSQGGAQGGGWVPVSDQYVVFIPTFRPLFPKTGKNWERTGVIPDVPVEADRALDAAHLRAIAAIDARASRQETRWLLPLLDRIANGPANGDTSGIIGRYEGVEITAEMKFLGASGVLRDLTPLSDGTFLIEDASVAARYRARIRFVRDASGNVTAAELLTPTGRVIPRPRL